MNCEIVSDNYAREVILKELQMLQHSHKKKYKGALSGRILKWIQSTLDSQTRLKNTGTPEVELTKSLCLNIGRLATEVLVNPLDGTPYERPMLLRGQEWEHRVFIDCQKLFSNSPLDGGAMAEPIPHLLTIYMIALSKNILCSEVREREKKPSPLDRKYMEVLDRNPEFSERRRAVYTRLFEAARNSFPAVDKNEVRLAEAEMRRMLGEKFTSEVGDCVRGSLIVNYLDQIRPVVKAIVQQLERLNAHFRVKNFYTSPTPLGYVAIHIIGMIPIPGEAGKWILIEFQIHSQNIMDGTLCCVKEVAHRLYKIGKEVAGLSEEVHAASNLMYLMTLARLWKNKHAPINFTNDNTLGLLKGMSEGNDDKYLGGQAIIFLSENSRLGGGVWNERIQAVVPHKKNDIRTALLEIAKKVDGFIKVPAVPKNPSIAWKNTATSTGELLGDAERIKPIFVQICETAAKNARGGCSVNFGPGNGFMVKKIDSLQSKIRDDIERSFGEIPLTEKEEFSEWRLKNELRQFFSELIRYSNKPLSQLTNNTLTRIEELDEISSPSLFKYDAIIRNLIAVCQLKKIDPSRFSVARDLNKSSLLWRRIKLLEAVFQNEVNELHEEKKIQSVAAEDATLLVFTKRKITDISLGGWVGGLTGGLAFGYASFLTGIVVGLFTAKLVTRPFADPNYEEDPFEPFPQFTMFTPGCYIDTTCEAVVQIHFFICMKIFPFLGAVLGVVWGSLKGDELQNRIRHRTAQAERRD